MRAVGRGECLDPPVEGVCYKNVCGGRRHVGGQPQLSVARPVRAELAQVTAVGVERLHAAVGRVGHVHRAVRRNVHAERVVQLPVARSVRAERSRKLIVLCFVGYGKRHVVQAHDRLGRLAAIVCALPRVVKVPCVVVCRREHGVYDPAVPDGEVVGGQGPPGAAGVVHGVGYGIGHVPQGRGHAALDLFAYVPRGRLKAFKGVQRGASPRLDGGRLHIVCSCLRNRHDGAVIDHVGDKVGPALAPSATRGVFAVNVVHAAVVVVEHAARGCRIVAELVEHYVPGQRVVARCAGLAVKPDGVVSVRAAAVLGAV